LKPVMIEEGVYRNLCTEDELRDGVELCHEQDLRWVSPSRLFGSIRLI
jgi:hypothetical protein